MENKKTFCVPTCEVVRFAVEDIVAASEWNTELIDGFDIPDVNSAAQTE